MKKLLGIVVLGLFWCTSSYSKDLTGLKLYCEQWGGFFKDQTFVALEFIDKSKVIEYEIIDGKLITKKKKYEVTPDKVKIFYGSYYSNVDRSELSYLNRDNTCDKFKKVDSEDNLKLKMEDLLIKVIKKQKKGNKI